MRKEREGSDKDGKDEEGIMYSIMASTYPSGVVVKALSVWVGVVVSQPML